MNLENPEFPKDGKIQLSKNSEEFSLILDLKRIKNKISLVCDNKHCIAIQHLVFQLDFVVVFI